MHVAMYDAIMAVVGTYRPFLVTPTATAPSRPRPGRCSHGSGVWRDKGVLA